MNYRKKIPNKTQTEVLVLCGRICGFCYGLNKDVRPKSGQIAHLDKNRNNHTLSNLMWMCIPHHDQYDSTTRQSKNLTIGEARKYRDDVWLFKSRSPTNLSIAVVRDLIEKHHRLIDYSIDMGCQLAVEHSLKYMDDLEDFLDYLYHHALIVTDNKLKKDLETLHSSTLGIINTLSHPYYLHTLTRRKFDNTPKQNENVQAIIAENKIHINKDLKILQDIWKRFLMISENFDTD